MDSYEREVCEKRELLRRFAIKLTRDVNRAEDLVQETMVAALSKRHQFEPGTSLKAWLYTILKNRFLSDIRKNREIEDPDGLHASKMKFLPEQLGHIEYIDLIKAIGKLPIKQRETLILVGYMGFTYEDAARELDTTVGTVKSRVSRARAKLSEID